MALQEGNYRKFELILNKRYGPEEVMPKINNLLIYSVLRQDFETYSYLLTYYGNPYIAMKYAKRECGRQYDDFIYSLRNRQKEA